jgi:hypothetical protein
MVIATDGPLCQRLNGIAEDLRARLQGRTEELAEAKKARDKIRERIRRLTDLVESGDAPAKHVVERIRDAGRELEATDICRSER